MQFSQNIGQIILKCPWNVLFKQTGFQAGIQSSLTCISCKRQRCRRTAANSIPCLRAILHQQDKQFIWPFNSKPFPIAMNRQYPSVICKFAIGIFSERLFCSAFTILKILFCWMCLFVNLFHTRAESPN